jgi:2-iminobutanoate/2-iminopropanoate deaminase
MPKKEIIRVEKMAATNPNLSLATRFGNLVFVAGQTGRHPVTGELGKDIREQTRNVLERIKMILAAAGTSLNNVLTVTTHLTKREDLAPYNDEYGAQRGKGPICLLWTRSPTSSRWAKRPTIPARARKVPSASPRAPGVMAASDLHPPHRAGRVPP